MRPISGVTRSALFVWLVLCAACAGWRDEVRRSGALAQGTLLVAEETGILINGTPLLDLHLRVEAPSRAPFEAVARELVPLTQLYLLAPGRVLPVRFDPNDPTHVVLVRERDAPVPRADLAAAIQRQQAQYVSLREAGTLARARVLKYTPLGATVNGQNPFVELYVEVTPDAAPPFNAVVQAVIGAGSVDKYAPGRAVFVRYDPNDLRRVALSGSDQPDTSVTSSP